MTESLGDDEAAYAYVRSKFLKQSGGRIMFLSSLEGATSIQTADILVLVKLGNDEYSERVKFAFVVWQGL
jgi:hypothetical protein